MSVWQDLWASFTRVGGPVWTVVGGVLAIAGPLYLPAAVVRVSVVWIVVAVLVMATAVLTAWDMVARARRQARDRLPRVRAAVTAGDAGAVILVLARSELFGVNVLVAIYYTEPLSAGLRGGLERLIGVGRVTNIQQDGLIQVSVLRELRRGGEMWRRVRNREPATLDLVVVKPSVPYDWDDDEGAVDD